MAATIPPMIAPVFLGFEGPEAPVDGAPAAGVGTTTVWLATLREYDCCAVTRIFENALQGEN
jgi:hypothetical protein